MGGRPPAPVPVGSPPPTTQCLWGGGRWAAHPLHPLAPSECLAAVTPDRRRSPLRGAADSGGCRDARCVGACARYGMVGGGGMGEAALPPYEQAGAVWLVSLGMGRRLGWRVAVGGLPAPTGRMWHPGTSVAQRCPAAGPAPATAAGGSTAPCHLGRLPLGLRAGGRGGSCPSRFPCAFGGVGGGARPAGRPLPRSPLAGARHWQQPTPAGVTLLPPVAGVRSLVKAAPAAAASPCTAPAASPCVPPNSPPSCA